MPPPPGTNEFDINVTKAIASLNNLQRALGNYNSTLGDLAGSAVTFNKQGEATRVVLTQVTSSGDRTVTTLKRLGTGYQVVSVVTGQATKAQLAYAAALASTPPPPPAPAAGPGIIPGPVAAPRGPAPPPSTFGLLPVRKDIIAIREGLGQLTAAGETFKKKLNEIGHIGFATLVYRSISLIQLGFTQSAEKAAEFQRTLGLISTLVDQNAGSFERWREEIRVLSDELGRPATEVALAAYDALSNQVIQTTEDFELLRVAGELAATTNATVANSVDTLSGIINGFGRNMNEARIIGDKLFTTVDLGKVRLDQLADSVGRSAGLATNLGVSLDEVLGSIAFFTQAGINSAEAVTLLNNVMVQLTKPNEALSAQFQQMGFNSGQAAVATLGFVGTLKELATAARDTEDGLATFFPEIRGLRGVTSGASDDFQKLSDAILRVREAGPALKEATESLNENLGKRFFGELNKITNFFTDDIGGSFLKSIFDLTDGFGGLAASVKEVTSVTYDLIKVGAGLFVASKVAAYGSALLKVIVHTKALHAATSLLGAAQIALNAQFALLAAHPVTVALTVLVGAIGAITIASGVMERRLARAFEAADKSARDFYKDLGQIQTQVQVAQTKLFEEGLKRQASVYNAFIANLIKQNDKVSNAAKETATETGEALKNALGVFTDVLEDEQANLESISKKGIQAIKGLTENAARGAAKLAQDQFDAAFDRIRDREQRISKARDGGIASLARQKLLLLDAYNLQLKQQAATAAQLGDIETIDEIYESIAENIRKVGSETAPGSDRKQFVGLEKALAGLEANRLNLIKAAAKVQEQKGEAARKESLELQKQLKILSDLREQAANFTPFDKQGKFLPEFKDAEGAIKGFDAIVAKLNAAIAANERFTNPAIMKNYASQLATVREEIEKRRKAIIDAANAERKGLALIDLQRQLTERQQAAAVARKEADAEQQRINNRINEGATQARKLLEILRKESAETDIGKPIEELLRLLNDPANKAPLILETFRELKATSESVGKTFAGDVPTGPKGQLEAYSEAVDKIGRSLFDLKGAAEAIPAIQAEFAARIKEIQAPTEEFRKTVAAAGLTIESLPGQLLLIPAAAEAANVSINPLTTSMNSLTTAINGVISAIGRLNATTILEKTIPIVNQPVRQIPKRYHGGPVGADSLLTRTTPGETVVKNPYSGIHHSLLQAINRGQVRSGGGITNNYQFGDIVTNVKDGSGVNVNDIGRQIRRSIRQGRIRL